MRHNDAAGNGPARWPSGARREPAIGTWVRVVTGRWEAVGGSLAVAFGGKAVLAGLVETGVAHEFGDEDEVVTATDEGAAEGVA